MARPMSAFSPERDRAVRELKHKEKSIYISAEDIFNAQTEYGLGDYKKYVNDRFLKEHGMEITDFEKLVFRMTFADNITRVDGHEGYSLRAVTREA